AYRKANKDKDPAAVTALGYDAYLVIRAAIARAKTTDGPKLRDAINATKNFPGAAGTITFDENRNAVKSAVIKTVKNGKFVYMDTIQPSK
ncbi:MAG TPA: branched-chain amino acid ABC transporter substrate-binding protein, partial [Firmicutes bacterium]|nr:branched-chain amino acid ABC transporter substrate-binding protein [Bacillota bacterium]